jgi:hypothetical protein
MESILQKVKHASGDDKRYEGPVALVNFTQSY